MRRISPFLAVAFLQISIATHAEVYKWTGPDGSIHYGDNPPPDNSAKAVRGTNFSEASTLPEVVIEESTMKFFPIYGTTSRALQASINANGPFNEMVKQHVAAEISWRLNWKFDTVSEKDQCKIGKFKILLSTEITFPKWINPEAADEAVRSLWERVAKKIRVHEDGHKEIGVEAANVLARRLRALAPTDSCEALNAKITKERNRIYTEYTQLHRAYDRIEVLKIKPGGLFVE